MEITGIETKNTVLDVSDFFKELIKDPSFKKASTKGRKGYYRNVRKK